MRNLLNLMNMTNSKAHRVIGRVPKTGCRNLHGRLFYGCLGNEFSTETAAFPHARDGGTPGRRQARQRWRAASLIVVTGIVGVLLAGIAWAQQSQPSVEYLRGLNVPYVPTNQATVEAMLRIAGVRAGDFVIDLGSGDGRILITAAKLHGARGLGVDLDPERVRESRENARVAGVADRLTFQQRDLFETDLSRATVITLYLLPEVNEKLRPRLLSQLKPGTRIVTHDFDLGAWKPDMQARVRGYGTDIHFYVVPAQVAGRWRIQVGAPPKDIYELELSQRFQEVDGTVTHDGKFVHLRDTHLEGGRLRFVLIDADDHRHRLVFDGLVAAGSIEGVVVGEGAAPRARRPWRAVKR